MFPGAKMALTPAEKQRRYRERHRDRPTPAQEIAVLKARIADLERQIRGEPEPSADRSLTAVDEAVIAEWERARGLRRNK